MRVRFALIMAAAAAFPAAARAAASPVELNTILPLTGSGAFLGTQEKTALDLLEKVVNAGGGINGRPVQFRVYDDQSSPQVTVQDFNEIEASNPPLVLGSAVMAMCNAITPLVQRGPVQYCFSPTLHPAPGSFVFVANPSTYDAMRTMVRFYRLKGWTRIALITSTDATGQDAVRGFGEAFALPENGGVKLVAREQFNPTDLSVAAQVERMKAASPQALLLWTTGTPFATVLKGVIQAGLDVPAATSFGNQTYAQMRQYAEFLPKDLYIASSAWPEHGSAKLDPGVEAAKREFYGAYAAAGLVADSASVQSWDPARIAITALRALPPDPTAAQLRDKIDHMKGVAGVNGPYDFEQVPQRGLSEDAIVVTRWSKPAQGFEIVSEPRGIPPAP
jgi:branched-chain amino acid transport system substrate-binding protein